MSAGPPAPGRRYLAPPSSHGLRNAVGDAAGAGADRGADRPLHAADHADVGVGGEPGDRARDVVGGRGRAGVGPGDHVATGEGEGPVQAGAARPARVVDQPQRRHRVEGVETRERGVLLGRRGDEHLEGDGALLFVERPEEPDQAGPRLGLHDDQHRHQARGGRRVGPDLERAPTRSRRRDAG